MIMTGDNQGPPTAEEVNKLLPQAAKEMPGVKLKFGRLEDFYDAIMAENNEQHSRRPRRHAGHVDSRFRAMPIETKTGLQRASRWKAPWRCSTRNCAPRA